MRTPDPGARFYWFSAGDILRRHPLIGAEPLPLEDAFSLHAFHLREQNHANHATARGFHRARGRELGDALRARVDWRRAASGVSAARP